MSEIILLQREIAEIEHQISQLNARRHQIAEEVKTATAGELTSLWQEDRNLQLEIAALGIQLRQKQEELRARQRLGSKVSGDEKIE